jgi:hypothetical protein
MVGEQYELWNYSLCKTPNIQIFILLPFLAQWEIQMKIETRSTARLKALNFRVLYLQHNLPHFRMHVENDVLHLSDMFDSERTETLVNPSIYFLRQLLCHFFLIWVFTMTVLCVKLYCIVMTERKRLHFASHVCHRQQIKQNSVI